MTSSMTVSRYAPQYHFYTPDQARCAPFDPNGAIYWKGRYHLFYIYQDPQLPHGGHCWGHASSRDLIAWTIHRPALLPDTDGPDKGIFSGCALIDKQGKPTLVYYGIGAGCCIARALDDELIHWEKSPHNPVLPETGDKPENDVYHVFDPHVWLEGDHYIGIFGSRLKPFLQHDTAYMFCSDDLVHWEYLRPFYMPNRQWTDPYEDMACPDFFQLGDRHVLLGISHHFGARYYLGDYRHGTFVAQSHHRLNFPGGSLFAPESCLDGHGRRVVWFWLFDQQRDPIPEPGNQIMALPRIMRYKAEDAAVCWDIPEEYKQLRGDEKRLDAIALAADGQVWRPDSIASNAFELELVIPELNGRFELRVLESLDAREYASIVIDTESQSWCIDSSRMGSRATVNNFCPIYPLEPNVEINNIAVQKAPFPLRADEKLHLRVFVDHSVVEIFANGRHSMSQRVYPSGDDCRHISLRADRGMSLDTLRYWEMGRLTFTMATDA